MSVDLKNVTTKGLELEVERRRKKIKELKIKIEKAIGDSGIDENEVIWDMLEEIQELVQ